MMLYIHIPFCEKKCPYCDFLSFDNGNIHIEPYVSAICKEIECRSPKPIESLTSIFFGGGTPSLLNYNQLSRIFISIFDNFNITDDCEITLEINPGTYSKDIEYALNDLPINRVSLGLQSANNTELKILGRIHTFSDFLKTYEGITRTKIENISVDIMTGIPNQTLETLENTLKLVCGLRPNHISTYSLELHPNTPFGEKYKKGTAPLPNDEEEYNLYRLPIDYLVDKGYDRYEISNFARDGKQSSHNLGYWNRLPYLGVGIGASSLIEKSRYKNTEDIFSYLGTFLPDIPKLTGDYYSEIRKLTLHDEIEEFMFLGLRKINGVLLSRFEALFEKPMDVYYHKEIDYLTKNGFATLSYGILSLTDLGLDLSNQVLSRFLLD